MKAITLFYAIMAQAYYTAAMTALLANVEALIFALSIAIILTLLAVNEQRKTKLCYFE